MPRDEWAKARAKDVARRGKRLKPLDRGYKSRRSKSKSYAAKEKKRAKIRSQAKASRRGHQKALGQAAKMYRIPAGSSVMIRKSSRHDWMPYTTRVAVVAPISFQGGDYVVVRFGAWLIKTPGPTGF